MPGVTEVGAPVMWRLSVQERGLSAARRRLHRQIDAGEASADVRAEERRVSAERRRLHDLIGLLGGRFIRT